MTPRPASRLRAALRTALAAPLALACAALLAACAAAGGGASTDPVVARVPFGDGERLVYRLVDRDGETAGRGVFTTARDGGDLVLTQTYEGPDGAVADESRVVADAATLRPRSLARDIAAREGAPAERVEASYGAGGDGAPLVRAVRTRGGDRGEREIVLRKHHYEDQSSLWLWRTLALGEGYEARYTSVDPREGGQLTVAAAVAGRRTRETPLGAFDTWVLQIRTGRETANVWIHVNPPHEVVRFDNGRLFFELEESSHPGPR